MSEKDTEIKKGQYRCAMCKQIFNLVIDEDWNNDKALEEFKKNFPYSSTEDDLVQICDDCWQVVKPD